MMPRHLPKPAALSECAGRPRDGTTIPALCVHFERGTWEVTNRAGHWQSASLAASVHGGPSESE
jgi:hypothetical protein